MNTRWQAIAYTGLAVIVLMLMLPGCPGLGNGSGKIPVAAMKKAAPNDLGLGGITVAETAVPGKGALVFNNGLRLWVPGDAVSTDTAVTVRQYTELPDSLVSEKEDALEAIAVSGIYDLGPDGVSFAKPVKVTMVYDEELLPPGADENNIGPVYWDGKNWVPLEREIDTETNTVTFMTGSFPGIATVLIFGLKVAWPVALGIKAVLVPVIGWSGLNIARWAIKDPLYHGKASEYITPNDPVVQKWADMIRLSPEDNAFGETSMKDIAANPALMQQILTKGHGVFRFYDGNGYKYPVYQKDWWPDDWQKPADYFNNGMKGDCKNVANAMVSIFRHYGLDAKCVDGYTGGVRHGWAELSIGGKVYYIGANAELMPLDDAIEELKLERPANDDGKGFMWDENGQKTYDLDWWDNSFSITISTDKTYPGGEVETRFVFKPGRVHNIQIALEGPGNYKADYEAATNEETGLAVITLPIPGSALPGIYKITANDAEWKQTSFTTFYVNELRLDAYVSPETVTWQDSVNVNIQLSHRIITPVILSVLPGNLVTNVQGIASYSFTVPDDAEPGRHTITVSAPELGIFSEVSYEVAFPALMDVYIAPATAPQGGTITVYISIDPPMATGIQFEGFLGSSATGPDGTAAIQLDIPANADPGNYQLTVMAPEAGLFGFGEYTVTKAINTASPIPSTTAYTGTAYTAAKIGLGLVVEQSGVSGARVVGHGSPYLRVTQTGNHITGQTDINYANDRGALYLDIWINGTNRTVSGSCSFSGQSGTNYYFEFTNLPQAEKFVWELANSDMDHAVFEVTGNTITGHLSNYTYVSPELGYNLTRSSIVSGDEEDIYLYIYLAAAGENEISSLTAN